MEQYVIGVDLGGTSVKMGLFSSAEELVEKWDIPTNTTNQGSYILKDILHSIESKLTKRSIQESDIKGIGMGIPGTVIGEGYVGAAVNLGWKEKDVVSEFKQMSAIGMKVANDANVAALGEMWKGSAKGYDNLVLLTLGTGIGGGTVIDGKIVTGLFGAAGEFGHIPIVVDETQHCACGKIGCLEQAASATGIARYAGILLEQENDQSILRDSGKITAQSVFDAAKAGDDLAIRVVERAGNYLGQALAVITGVVDPQIFIIGGGVSRAGQYLIDNIQKHYQEKVLYLSKKTEIRLASLGNDAGIYGAAKLVL